MRVVLEKHTAINGMAGPGVAARVSKAIDGREVVLANTLFARAHTPLASVLAAFSKIENISHILVWCEAPTGPALPLIARVELPRLGLTFGERHAAGARRLYSVDHANLFLPNFAYGGSQVR